MFGCKEKARRACSNSSCHRGDVQRAQQGQCHELSDRGHISELTGQDGLPEAPTMDGADGLAKKSRAVGLCGLPRGSEVYSRQHVATRNLLLSGPAEGAGTSGAQAG
ncbi:unnamed protein product [Prorocentrum cordatum]|uniref:Uncharacterized protein n=1 Tax=Prorocentrum cordatum TaxID=2364126 RepID=A0ABN9XPN3_9DINO|nr:unnamed protein product [Polarella glacialis]